MKTVNGMRSFQSPARLVVLLFFVFLIGHVVDLLTYDSHITPAAAAETSMPSTMQARSHIGGWVDYLSVRDDGLAFLCQGNTVKVIDTVIKPYERKSTVILPREASCLARTDEYLYLIYYKNWQTNEYADSLAVVSIADPLEPSLVHSLVVDDVSNSLMKLLVSGTTLCVVSQSATWGVSDMIVFYDISNPVSPVSAGKLTGSNYYDVALSGNYAYVLQIVSSSETRLLTFDISDKENPSLTSTVDVPKAYRVAVSGASLFVACNSSGGLKIFDISHPESPVQTGGYGEGANSYSGIVADDSRVYLSFGVYLTVVDASDNDAPVLLGKFSTGFQYSFLAASGDVVYISNSEKGDLLEIDTGNPSNPVTESNYASPSVVSGVAANGMYLFNTDLEHTVYTYDLSAPGTPESINSFSVNDLDDIFASDDALFVSDANGTVRVYDMEDIATSGTPDPTGLYTADGTIEKLIVRGQYGYILSSLANGSRLEIVDLNDLSSPSAVGQADIPGTGVDLHVPADGSKVFAAYRDGSAGGFLIIDVSEPAAPDILSQNTVTYTPVGVWAGTDILVLAANDAGTSESVLLAWDISSPASPVSAASENISSNTVSSMEALDGVFYLSVTDDDAVYTYGYDESAGSFTKGMSANVLHPMKLDGFKVGDTAGKAAPRVAEDSYDTYYLYTTEESYGEEVIEIKKPKETVQKYKLVVGVSPSMAQDDGCTTVPGPGTYWYNKDEVVSLQAVAASGWSWYAWQGAPSRNPTSVTMSGDMEAIAIFQPLMVLGFTSPDAGYIFPPNSAESLTIGTAVLAAYGVDWTVNSISFNATGNAKAADTKAFLDISGTVVEGAIETDGEGNILAVSFPVGKVVKEGQTLSMRLYYKFSWETKIPGKIAPSPLEAVMTYGVSVKSSLVSAEPVPDTAKPGILLPSANQEFTSSIQTVASVWDVTANPPRPYLTVNDACNGATIEDGHVIEVGSGKYENTHADISKKNITLKSHNGDPSLTVLTAVAQDGSSTVTALVCNSDNVLIQGFTIDGNNSEKCNGITLSSTNAKIHNNIFGAGLYKGVAVQTTNFQEISGNTFSAKMGLHLSSVTQGTVSNNTFTLTPEATNKTISLDECGNMTISGNTATGGMEILLEVSNNNTITKNTIPEDRLVSKVITIENSNGNILTENESFLIQLNECQVTTVKDNTLSGIASQKGTNNMFLNNVIENGNAGPFGYYTSQDTKSPWVEVVAGLYLLDTKSAVIRDNTIRQSTRAGISTLVSKKTIIENNQIYNNSGNGIEIVGGTSAVIKNGNRIYNNQKSGVNLYESHDIVIQGNRLYSNLVDGVTAVQSSRINVLDNTITDHNGLYSRQHAGIDIEKVLGGLIQSNNLLRNCTGIHMEKSNNIKVTINNISDSFCLLTGIHLVDSSPEIISNTISNNNGNGIFAETGANPYVSGNNIYNNSENGLANDDPGVTISAPNNWWGADERPSVGLILGNVETATWLATPKTLVVDAEVDTLYAASSVTDSVSVFVRNLSNAEDEVLVTLSDDRGWLSDPKTMTVSLTDSAGAAVPVIFTVPAGTGGIFVDNVTISAVSQSEEDETAVGYFRIQSYEPRLESLTIQPDSTTLVIGSRQQFIAWGTDQYGNEIIVEPVWAATSGTISGDGLFVTPETDETVTVTATDTLSGITTEASVKVTAEEPYLTSILLEPGTVTIETGESVVFKASGFNQYGYPCDFGRVWTASGGDITENGIFTADTAGTYTVKVTDPAEAIGAEATVNCGIMDSVEDNSKNLPAEFVLYPCHPNPFNPSTTIEFNLPETVEGSLVIYSITGQKLITLIEGRIEAGRHSAVFDGSGYASGLYLYRLYTGKWRGTGKMVLMK